MTRKTRSYPEDGTLYADILRAAVSFDVPVCGRDIAALTGRSMTNISNTLANAHNVYPHLLRRVRAGVYVPTDEARDAFAPYATPEALAYVADREEGRLDYYISARANKRKRKRLGVIGAEVIAVPLLQHAVQGWALELDGELITTADGRPVWWPGIEEVQRGARRLIRERKGASRRYSRAGRATS